jgi:pectate lyase
VIRVTLHHNYFRRTVQRHPRLRFGKVHAFNNYLYQWKSYGMASCIGAQLLSERNIFEAGTSKKGVISTDCPSSEPAGYVVSRKDWELNGVSIDENGASKVFACPSSFRSRNAEVRWNAAPTPRATCRRCGCSTRSCSATAPWTSAS